MKLPQIDSDRINTKLSLRERIALKLLLVIFALIYPYRYQHEMTQFAEELLKEAA